jgi:23S rRNA pseudouridine1911/1915/1917 synthase
MKIKILYEDKNILVIDKPAGVLVHGDGKEGPQPTAAAPKHKSKKEETIVDWFSLKYPKSKNVGEDILDLNGKLLIKKSGVVHRLDKETSGCLVLCKNTESYRDLKKQFQNHNIQKEYIAICLGWPKHETGIINLPIARSKSDFRKKDVVDRYEHTRGEEREALTRFKVLKNFEVKIRGKSYKFSLINFYPKTGRMHQIRVHAKSIGHVILGDKLYGDRGINAVFSKMVKRHLLHAKSIKFTIPEKEELFVVEADLPPDFKKFPIAKS